MSRTILLADDSVTIRKVVELTFSDTDIRVESVGSGREALDRLDALRPDLVLADVAMPGPSGYEVCERVKASPRPVPVLLLAGTFEPFDPRRAVSCGADGHLVKPFESRALLARVEELLARPAAATPPAPAAGEEELESVLDDRAVEPAPADRAGERFPSPRPLAAEAAEALAEPAPAAGVAAAAARFRLTPEEIDAVARAVLRRLSDEVLREIAWEVVPDLAETIIRDEIRRLTRA